MTPTDPLLEQALRFHQAGDYRQAEPLYRQILQIDPHEVNALNLLGVCAHEAGRHAEALPYLTRAVGLNPGFAPIHNNLGMVYQALGRLAEAVVSYQEALRLQPGYALAHANLGTAFWRQGRLAEAEASYRQALALQPNDATTTSNLGCVLKDQGLLAVAVACFRRALELDPNQPLIHSNLLLSLHYVPGVGPEALAQEHRRWADRHAAPLSRAVEPHPNPRDPDRQLRLGFVSPDFREHPVAHFLHPVLTNLDRRRFHVVCYADVPNPDAWTARLQAAADGWRSLLGMSHAQAAAQIRADRIDVLVDLAGHTARNRLMAFARKPAPVQVTHFGYPNTTGLPTMDYRITDALADPPGATAHWHTEELLRLPEIAWCYEPGDSPEVGPLPALQAGHVTFGSLNNPPKVTPEVVAVWARVLRAVPGSRLLLLASAAGQANNQVREAFAANGIAPDRLEFLGRQARDGYLRAYHRIDLALDPFPYNGGVTTCDALWMGVPVVALAGNAYVSRQGVSLLSCVGLGAWVAATPAEYVAQAVRRATDPEALAQVRQGLRQRVRESPVGDGARYTRHLEAALLAAWARWCAAGG
jgi:predicted O-linked N-acetylglucosamine transferase (SPINDLY family)